MKIPASVQKWQVAMKDSEAGRRVLDNIKKEKNVSEKIRSNFFVKLGKTYQKGKDPLIHMDYVLSTIKDTALAGPERDLNMTLLTRFSKIARLPEEAVFKSGGIGYQGIIHKPELLKQITSIQLGKKGRGIVWAALHDPVDTDKRRGMSFVDILDKLGVTKQVLESWYNIVYNASDFDSPCHIPTVFDAGSFPYFVPTDKDADSGMTFYCSKVEPGYPEYTHDKCTINNPGITPHIFEKEVK